MSKSLNQAFIRAYSKEKASRPVAPPSLVSAQFADKLNEQLNGQLNEQFDDAGLIDFVVRFDTATCGVPAPHTPASDRSSDKPREAVAVAAGPRRSPGSRPARAVPTAPATVAAVPRLQDEAELRSAIAQQMNRAGEWDGSNASAFQGGFPMLSQHHQRTPAVRTVPIQSQASPPQVPGNSNSGNSSSSGLPSNRSPSVSSGGSRPVSGSLDHGLLYTSSGGLDSGRSPAQPNPAGRSSASSTASQREKLAQENQAEFSSGKPVPPKKEIRTPNLQSPALLSHQTKPGDFFRLDRPSYSPAAAVQTEHDFSDSGESSSEILGLSASQVHLEPSDVAMSSGSLPRADTKLRQDAAHAAKIERVQLAERELRHSKLKIFNPVWEVDSFQWPDICLELLEQRSEDLETVARNLYEAVQEGLQVLAITSPQGGEGRTTVACCLAKLVGSRGLNVVIVDGDIDNPTLSYQTNLDIQQDWKSAILNQLPLEEIAVHSIDDQVTLVPLIGSIDDSELSVDDNRIEFMLHELSECFDLVIVDMGHMNSPRSLVDSLCARGAISAVVAVVDHRTSDARDIDHCLQRIRQAGVASIGVVENFAA